VERELIAQVMEACGNVQTKAATRLGINRNTLRSKLQQYNLESDGEGNSERPGAAP
jgi:DNA-binding protein Fis